MELETYRKQLDALDRQLVSLFLQRMELCRDIGRYKEQHGLPVYMPDREADILQRVATQAGDELAPYAEALYHELMSLSRRYQEENAPYLFGLLGETLGHSFSPMLHRILGGYEYGLFPTPPDALADFLKKRYFRGINVTIPYKQAVIPYLDALDPISAEIGAVNTIVNENGSLTGYNTDMDGFLYMARRAGIQLRGKKVLILGSGGTSHTAKAAAERSSAGEIVVISRTGKNNYQNIDRHRDADILVNTTPVGMWPHTGQSVVNLDRFPSLTGVLDVVYNPMKTALILEAERLGIPCSGGLPMLAAQAGRAVTLFTGKPIGESALEQTIHILRKSVENIVLIGMPGVGKTTLGRLLAQKTGRDFLDTDALVAKKAGTPVSTLIRQKGENRFRELETEVICQAAKSSSLVIATGGGTVLRKENRDAILQNSRVVWIRRPLSELPTHGRPLSQSCSLAALAEQREPLYRSMADLKIDNSGTIEDALCQLLKELDIP